MTFAFASGECGHFSATSNNLYSCPSFKRTCMSTIMTQFEQAYSRNFANHQLWMRPPNNVRIFGLSGSRNSWAVIKKKKKKKKSSGSTLGKVAFMRQSKRLIIAVNKNVAHSKTLVGHGLHAVAHIHCPQQHKQNDLFSFFWSAHAHMHNEIQSECGQRPRGILIWFSFQHHHIICHRAQINMPKRNCD